VRSIEAESCFTRAAALAPEPIRASQPHAGEDGKDIHVTIRKTFAEID
jgi:hypothetical protein